MYLVIRKNNLNTKGVITPFGLFLMVCPKQLMLLISLAGVICIPLSRCLGQAIYKNLNRLIVA